MRVVWSASALRQVYQAFEYLTEFNPRAAAELVQALTILADGLARFPHRGRLVPGTDKRELVAAYPYVIRYRIRRDEVRVLRVRHASRRPTVP